MGSVWLRARSACPPPFPVPVCGVGVRAGVWVSAAPRLSLGGCWAVCVLLRLSRFVSCTSWLGLLCGGACFCSPLVPRLSWLGCGVWACVRGPSLGCAPPFLVGLLGSVFCAFFVGRVLVWLCGVGCWLSLSRALWSLFPHPLSFGLGCWLFFFPAWCVSACFGVLFPGGPLFLALCCQFWLGGPPVPLWGSCLRCLLGGRFSRLLWCWRAVRRLLAVLSPPPLPPCFFSGGGLPVPPSAFPGLANALARFQCGLPGCCWRLRSAWPCSGPMDRVGYVHVALGAPSCGVRSWLCPPGGCARRLRVALD